LVSKSLTMRSRLIRLSPALAGVATIIVLVALALLLPQPAERLRLATFDTLQRAFPWAALDTPVTVADVDEQSLTRYGQ
jgi:CHASE2 domain-containing sensor protein